MLLQYLLCALCVVPSAFSRVLPISTQVPFVASQQDHAKPEHMGVMIAFQRSGEDHESTFQFPERQPIRGMFVQSICVLCVLTWLSGSVLHNDPWHNTRNAVDSVKVVAVLDLDTAASGSLEELARIRCRIEPEFSIEEVRAASSSGVELGVWPTFGFEDGVVILNRSDSRWFLAGRSIGSIECW